MLTAIDAGQDGAGEKQPYPAEGVARLGSLLKMAETGNRGVITFALGAIANGENAVNLAGQADGSLSPDGTRGRSVLASARS